MIGGDLEGDLIPWLQCNVALHVVFPIGQEEALAPVLVADPSLACGARLVQLSSDCPHHTLLTQHLIVAMEAIILCTIFRLTWNQTEGPFFGSKSIRKWYIKSDYGFL